MVSSVSPTFIQGMSQHSALNTPSRLVAEQRPNTKGRLQPRIHSRPLPQLTRPWHLRLQLQLLIPRARSHLPRGNRFSLLLFSRRRAILLAMEYIATAELDDGLVRDRVR